MVLQPFYTGYVILIFMATLLLVLPFYLLLAIPARPWSRRAVSTLTRIWSRTWLSLNGLRVHASGLIPSSGKFIIIANHVSYLDPIVIYDVIPFYFRPLAKYEVSKIPVFGFVYAQIAILVDRSSAARRARSMRQMQEALRHECSIFLYPEGTFNETKAPMKSFYDGAFRLAIEAQVPILPVIFPDTRYRWQYEAWWKIWPGKNRAFVLEPVPVAGLTTEDTAMLRDRVHMLMSAEMLRHRDT